MTNPRQFEYHIKLAKTFNLGPLYKYFNTYPTANVRILEEGTKISIIRTFELCTTKLIIYMSDNILIYVMLIKLPSKVKLFGFNLHIALYTYTQSQKRKINITLLVLEFWLFDIQQQDQTIGNN